MQVVDAALVDKITRSLKDSKAADLDSLTAEHLKYSHPALATVLAKLFNIMLIFGCLPSAFGRSYTVPLPKGGHAIGKGLTVEDFRGSQKYLSIVYLTYMQLALQPAKTNLTLKNSLAVSTLYTP